MFVGWDNLLVGGVVGALAGLVVQNILFPALQQAWSRARMRAHFQAADSVWEAAEALFPELTLVQAGWDPEGYFHETAVPMTLQNTYTMPEPLRSRLRVPHENYWCAAGFKDGQQVGIETLQIVRVSDDARAERRGQSHSIALQMHTYRYFDVLASHFLLVRGSAVERELLAPYVQHPDPQIPIHGFPNPCSVGLSLLCEGGDRLVLSRRTTSNAAGGHWQGGKLFNLVGENAAPRDFSPAYNGERKSTPFVVARRGLWEEAGLSARPEADVATLRLHSLAWARDLLDHKFFGYAVSPLSYREVLDRWQRASDRSESGGAELTSFPLRTGADVVALVREIVHHAEDWAPEATFCTIRSLLASRRLSPKDLLRVLERK